MPYMTETEHSNLQRKLSEQDKYIDWSNNRIASLESSLREAEAIIKPIAEHDAKWAGVGEVAIFLPPEHYARAAAFLAGGDTNKV